MRYGGGTLDVPLRLRGVAHFPPVVSTICNVTAVVLQTLHNCRISVLLSRCGPYIQISETTATARISHLRTKDARNHTIHTPGSDERRTQKHRRHIRHTCFSYAFKYCIAPASLSSACFNTRHTPSTDVIRPLSNQQRTRYKPATSAFAPATHENRTGIKPLST